GDDERDRNRIAVLGHVLARIEPQADHAHRPAVRDLLEADRAPRSAGAWRRHCIYHRRPARLTIQQMRVRHGLGVEGARDATGIVVVIDVLRAFTVSAFALAGGARECLLVSTIDEARELAASTT